MSRTTCTTEPKCVRYTDIASQESWGRRWGWVSTERAVPATEVRTMGSIPNRTTRFSVDGTATVTGLVNVGDSAMSTNPSLGRGISLVALFAQELRGVLASTSERSEIVTRFDDATQTRLIPWFEDAVASDRRMLAIFNATLGGQPPGKPDDLTAIRAAASADMNIWRAVSRLSALEVLPNETAAIPGLVKRAQELLPSLPTPEPQISKEQLQEILRR